MTDAPAIVWTGGSPDGPTAALEDRGLFVAADGSSSFVNNPTAAMSESELSGRVAALGR